MMKDYLARGPMTTTERLVAQGGSVFGTSASTTTEAEKKRLMGAYIDRMARQVEGDRSQQR